jgi:hypothetical protein
MAMITARRICFLVAAGIGTFTMLLSMTGDRLASAVRADASPAHPAFQTSDNCMACHNGLTARDGEDISLGSAWRASMMANSARDPYWQASVRRETIDHPNAAEEIEDECSVCHMPMARTTAAMEGRRGSVFAHLPTGERGNHEGLLAADGVSCTMCHQITPERFGARQSFSGGYVIARGTPSEPRPLFGKYAIESGRARIMHSATGFRPVQSTHVRQSELCATCHTLYTNARGPDGQIVGQFPEQVPYLEWRHSALAAEQTCQSCHMPVVQGTTRVSSVLGELRAEAPRHDFRGGNFFMLRMLDRFRGELSVEALPHELDRGARVTVRDLQAETSRLQVSVERQDANRLSIRTIVENLTGHKLPTAYPSRRLWIHLTVRDGSGRMLFESGAVRPDGAIQGNDNDADPSAFEPHYDEIASPEQVQIYESVIGDSAGRVTTGLITAVRYLKDNRLLPRGFDKRTAHADIAVVGAAAGDANFTGAADHVRYVVETSGGRAPFVVEAELRFQPIGFRWADNLRNYEAFEPRRFVQYFSAMSSASSEVITRTRVLLPD